MRTLSTAFAVLSLAATAAAQVPLEASLQRGGSEPMFRVNQPAYVAVFEVIPGVGASQLFPRTGYQAARTVESGEYLLSRPLYSDSYGGLTTNRPMAIPAYLTDAYGRVRSYYYTTSWSGASLGARHPNRTLLLVASRAPLRRVQAPQAAQWWLQQVAGFRGISTAFATPAGVLTDIVSSITPLGVDPDDVVVDVLEVVGSELPLQQLAVQSISMSCDGRGYTNEARFFFDAGMYQCPTIVTSDMIIPRPSVPPGPPSDSAPAVPPLKPDLSKPALPTPDQDGMPGAGPRRIGPTQRWDGGKRPDEQVEQWSRARVSIDQVSPIVFDGERRTNRMRPMDGAFAPSRDLNSGRGDGYGQSDSPAARGSRTVYNPYEGSSASAPSRPASSSSGGGQSQYFDARTLSPPPPAGPPQAVSAPAATTATPVKKIN